MNFERLRFCYVLGFDCAMTLLFGSIEMQEEFTFYSEAASLGYSRKCPLQLEKCGFANLCIHIWGLLANVCKKRGDRSPYWLKIKSKVC